MCSGGAVASCRLPLPGRVKAALSALGTSRGAGSQGRAAVFSASSRALRGPGSGGS